MRPNIETLNQLYIDPHAVDFDLAGMIAQNPRPGFFDEQLRDGLTREIIHGSRLVLRPGLGKIKSGSQSFLGPGSSSFIVPEHLPELDKIHREVTAMGIDTRTSQGLSNFNNMALHLLAQKLPNTAIIQTPRSRRIDLKWAIEGTEVENRPLALSAALMLQAGKLGVHGKQSMHTIYDPETQRAHTFAVHESAQSGRFTIFDPSLGEILTLPRGTVPHTDMAPFVNNQV